MKKLIFLLLAGLALPNFSVRGDVVIANVFGRHTTSLNGKWHIIIDRYDTGATDYRRHWYDDGKKVTGGYAFDHAAQDKSELVEYNFDTSPTLNVPGDWNSQDDKLFYYEGTVWYRTKFDVKPLAPGHRLFVYFGAANYEANVYLNGKRLGKHIGGFTPFAYEITDIARPKDNSLVVRVNNERRLEGVPTDNTDWWNYGGITRDVLLVDEPSTFIANYLVRLKPGATNAIEAKVQLDGVDKSQSVKIEIPSLNLSAEAAPDQDGVAKFEMAAPSLALWSPENPVLNDVELSTGDDKVKDQIGFRTIETRGKDILLNGKKVFLRGVSVHEENPLRGGRAWSEADAKLLLGWAKDLGCNFVRLAHYPHNEHMARAADQMGIMCWSEIPTYWTIQWTNPDTLANAKQQLADMISRDQNRASVIVWSVGNEAPVSEARTKFLKALVDEARSMDGTRLVSAAMEVHSEPRNPTHKVVDDPFGQYTDLCSFNEYVGWYDGLPERIDKVTWTVKYDKPVFVSEFGADAKAGFHGDALTRFSEEYQADLYRRTLPMLDKIPGFSGCTPWILCDFRSPRRMLPNVQDGWNLKGLISSQGQKKPAFNILKEFYEAKARAEAGN